MSCAFGLTGQWTKLFALKRASAKLDALVSPNGQMLSVGVTSSVSFAGAAVAIDKAQAREMGEALLRWADAPAAEVEAVA